MRGWKRYGERGRLGRAHHVGRDDDQQFVSGDILVVYRRGVAEAGHLPEKWIAVETAGVVHVDEAGDHAGLTVLHRDHAAVFAIVDDGNAVHVLRAQRTQLQLKLQRHVMIAMYRRSGLQVHAEVLKIERGKRRDVALVADDLRYGGGVVDGGERRVDDGITFADFHDRGIVVRCPQGDVFQILDVGPVKAERGHNAGVAAGEPEQG